jgi:hypothetical protein
MRWLKLIERYALGKKPTLRAVNPRAGTSIIPLDIGDDQIFFQYLTNRIHSLHFQGSETQLKNFIHSLRDNRGITIHKMKTSMGRGKEKLILLNLELSDNVEIRRVVKLS